MRYESSTGSPTCSIEVKKLKKTFGNHVVLAGLDLEAKRGETVVLFGRNGAGKTTLIKVLATIMNPSSGEIPIDGLNPKTDAGQIRRRIGVITHQTFLYGNLTAYENLQFYSRMYDIPAASERIHETVGMVGMTTRLYNRVGTLSRGMQQRLSIARALLHRPAIMLLDEPETGLDQQSFAILRDILQTKDEEKHTIVLTTHSLERGLELGDRLLILERGRIVFDRSTENLDLDSLKEAYHNVTRVGE